MRLWSATEELDRDGCNMMYLTLPLRGYPDPESVGLAKGILSILLEAVGDGELWCATKADHTTNLHILCCRHTYSLLPVYVGMAARVLRRRTKKL